MTENNAVVATYKSHLEAESAVKELQSSGIRLEAVVDHRARPPNRRTCGWLLHDR